MAKIKGIPVILHIKRETTPDPFNAMQYETTTEVVDNVLVYPSSTDDITTTTNLTGKIAKYTLCIPKGDEHDWTNTVVEFFGKKWLTTGFEQEYIESLIPLGWNKKVTVESYG